MKYIILTAAIFVLCSCATNDKNQTRTPADTAVSNSSTVANTNSDPANNDESCASSPECLKDKNIKKYASDLNSAYLFAMSQNRYLQAQYDSLVRMTCREAGAAQQKGVSIEAIQERIKLAEGFSPEQRYLVNEVSKSCWELSKNGIPDGTVKIATFY